VRLAGTCGVGQKPPDYQAVPIDAVEHSRIHTMGTTTAEDAIIFERLVYLLIEYMATREGEGF